MASSSALKTIAQDEPMLDASNVGGDLTDLQTRIILARIPAARISCSASPQNEAGTPHLPAQPCKQQICTSPSTLLNISGPAHYTSQSQAQLDAVTLDHASTVDSLGQGPSDALSAPNSGLLTAVVSNFRVCSRLECQGGLQQVQQAGRLPTAPSCMRQRPTCVQGFQPPHMNNLAHSDSNVSLDQQVVGRVDSVALAHRRMSRLGNTDDSITVAKRRQRRNEEGDQGGSGGSDSCGMSADGAGNATAESSGVLPDRLPTGGSSEGADSPTRTGGLRQKLTSFFKGRTQDGSKGSSLSPASTARASGGEVGGEVPGLGRHSQVRFSEMLEEPPKEVPS